MGNEIYKILYVENNAEKVTQLRQLIRANTVDGKITFDVTTTDSVDGINVAVNKDHCDLVILQDSPKVPVLKEVNDAIGIKATPVLVLVNEEQFLEKRQIMIQEGAIDVGTLQQGDVLFKQMVRAIFELKTQLGYRDTLEKNARLTEITVQFASTSEDLIAYFGVEDGIFLYANDAFLQYFGFKQFIDLAATTVLEYVIGDESTQFKKMMKIVGKTGKEQAGKLSLKHPNGELVAEDVVLKQGMFEEKSCIELFVSRTSPKNAVVVSNTEVQPLSEQAKFYDRLSFINNLSNFVGSSSWLVSLVLQDYFDFRKKFGVEVLESYFLNLSKHLGAQIDNLHYARYSDESIVLLLTNSDMTKVDRLGMAIVSSSEGFTYKENDAVIQGKFTFAYTNLGDSVSTISDACNRLDELAGLLDTRVVFTDDEGEASEYISGVSVETVAGEDGDNVEEEFLPLYNALKNQQIKQTYVPVVDFSMKGQENYIASFNLYDEADELVVWNKGFTYTSDNRLMSKLDLFMIENAVNSLNTVDENKRIMIPLSMYFLERADDLLDWIKHNCQKYFATKQITIGLAEEVVDDYFEASKTFFSKVHSAGYLASVYNVVDVTSTKVLELNVSLIALSENCIARMSRSISSDEMTKLPQLLESLSNKGAGMLAMGVNSPTSMTLVWEYNIPYACGNMIGSARLALDFDFSQMMM